MDRVVDTITEEATLERDGQKCCITERPRSWLGVEIRVVHVLSPAILDLPLEMVCTY